MIDVAAASTAGERVLITGGAGFIGSHLAARLSQTGAVAVFDSFHPQVHGQRTDGSNALPSGCLVVRGDVRDATALGELIRSFDPHLVFHLAGETGTGQSFDEPSRYCVTNVLGTCNLIEACRAHGGSLRRVILASSRAIYGEGAHVDEDGLPAVALQRTADDLRAGIFTPKDRLGRPLKPVKTGASCPPAPTSIYASSKLMQEHLLRCAFWNTGIGVGIVRLQNVYGPGQSLHNPYTGIISIFVGQIGAGATLRVYEDGEITRDFVHVDDAVSALIAIGHVDALPADPVDIGSGIPTTIVTIAQQLLRLMDADPRRLMVTGEFRAGDVRHAVAEIGAAESLLGWRPEVDLAAGLSGFVDWARRV